MTHPKQLDSPVHLHALGNLCLLFTGDLGTRNSSSATLMAVGLIAVDKGPLGNGS